MEGGNFGSAGTGKLFLDALNHRFRQYAAHPANNPIAVDLSHPSGSISNADRLATGENSCDVIADADAEYLGPRSRLGRC